ncbi:MAG TPA: molybdate ABC transporter substrate-binding protein [Candidatus Angelobacter sp.]|nr:molybdate ABC transporter substrate-binding protein [Candidatus Angelobacter sp.]
MFAPELLARSLFARHPFFSSLVVLLFAVSGAQAQQEIKVAAAADLTSAMQKLAPAFEKQTGIHVTVSLGSSGNFFAQIQNGAPFDVFLSADRSYPEKLQQAGQAEPNTFTQYARGRLVLWTARTSNVHLAAKNGRVLDGDLKFLTGPEVRKIAIANPEHAPYGRAAVSALEHFKVYDQVKPKIVLGENISQTAQFAQSGNADVGLISLSLASSDSMANSGSYVLLPEDSYPPIEQAGIVVASSKNKEQAKRFLSFMMSADGQAILHDLGFEAGKK